MKKSVMKIAILGTKGIPNNYGGFEQFAEYLSVGLAKKGHSVTVFNPSFHPFKETYYKGVQIERIYSPEKYLGGAANFIYDFLCLRKSLKSNFDMIYEAGYHSVAPSFWLFNVRRIKKPIVITNMDGLEWRRPKWSSLVRRIILALEKLAVNQSRFLISDNLGIQSYYKDKFHKESFFLPYGADLVDTFSDKILEEYSLTREEYFIVVARLEPENNIELIIQAYLISNSKFPLIIVGNHSKKYGKSLKEKFVSSGVKFIGGIYDKVKLDSLRYFSLCYFHGHSVGGTNPSLLEAMASRCFICSHKNPFNESVLNGDALYFHDVHQLTEKIIDISSLRSSHGLSFINSNIQKIKTIYNWEKIVGQHEELFVEILANNE
jgi:glycosyltransferase involved in cell wall biosynthesis